MSKFLVILLFVGWSAGSTWYYTCEIKGLCETTTSQEVKKEVETSKTEEIPQLNSNLGFKLNEVKSSKGPGWMSYKDSLLQAISAEDNSLLIIGKYFKGEKSPDGFRNMGLARAQSLMSELADSTNRDKISISSEYMGERPVSYWNNSMDFSIEKIDNSQAKVVENQDGVIIYFPSGSSDALMSQAILDKLKRISKELVATDGGANIVGHTDNTGNRKANHILGQQRAERVKQMFLDNGVNPENLRASSMGDTQPTADNTTAEGRALNRRILVTFNDNK